MLKLFKKKPRIKLGLNSSLEKNKLVLRTNAENRDLRQTYNFWAYAEPDMEIGTYSIYTYLFCHILVGKIEPQFSLYFSRSEFHALSSELCHHN